MSSRLGSSEAVEHIVVVVQGDGPHAINGEKTVQLTPFTRIASGVLPNHSSGEFSLNVRNHAMKWSSEIPSIHIVTIGSQMANQLIGFLNQSGRKMVRCPHFRWEHHVAWGVEKLKGWWAPHSRGTKDKQHVLQRV